MEMAEILCGIDGIGLDIGSSTIHVIDSRVITKAKEETKIKNDDMGVSLTTLPSNDRNLESLVNAIQHETHGTGSTLKVNATGNLSSKTKDKFQLALGVEMNCTPKVKCVVDGFNYLAKRMNREKMLEPLLSEATEEPLAMMKEVIDSMVKAAQAGLTSDTLFDGLSLDHVEDTTDGEASKKVVDNVLVEAETTYPLLLVMLGSGVQYVKVEEDGSYNVIDYSERGGQTFHGLGSLLTGCKGFEELLSLAEKGDSKKVDIGNTDLKQEKSDASEDMYTAIMDIENDFVIYCFGKGVNAAKDDFEKADIVAALLFLIVLDVTQTTSLLASVHDCKHIFFSGSFSSPTIIRYLITRELTRANCFMYIAKGQGPGVPFDFVKMPSHLGAFGALVNDK